MKLSLKVIIVFFILFLSISINLSAEEKKMTPREVLVATVNGVQISEEHLSAEINRLIPLTTYHSKMSQARKKEFTQTAMDNLILNELKYQMAKKIGIEATKEEVKKALKSTISKFSSEKEYKAALKTNNVSEDIVEKIIEKNILVSKITRKEEVTDVEITDEDIKKYYEGNKSKFVLPEQRRLRVILLKVEPSASSETWKMYRKKAEEIREMALSGDDFAELAREYSDDKSAVNGGELGFLHKGQLMHELEREAYSLEKGAVGKVLQTLYGYHLVKVVEITKERQRSFEEINIDRQRVELKRKEVREIKEAWIARLKKGADIKIFIEGYDHK